MKTSAVLCLALGGALGVLGTRVFDAPAKAAAGPAQRCSQVVAARNATIVASTATIKPGSGGFDALLAPGYVQHNLEIARFAQINGMDIRTAMTWLETRGPRRRPPGPPPTDQPPDNRLYRIVAQCDLVVAVGQHWHPDPQFAGKYYATYFFNMWRLENGKLVEHWDPKDLPTPLPEHLRVPIGEMKGGWQEGA